MDLAAETTTQAAEHGSNILSAVLLIGFAILGGVMVYMRTELAMMKREIRE